MRIRVLLLLLAGGAAHAVGLPAEISLTDSVGGITAEWALPAGHGAGCILVVDPQGAPWLGCRSRFLIGAARAELLGADKPFESLAWLASGALLAVTGEEVGVYGVAAAEAKGAAAARLPFRSLARFPGATVRIYGGEDVAYVVSTTSTRSEVFLLKLGEQGWSRQRLFTTTERVTALAGDGTRTFVAHGRRIIALTASPNHSLDMEVVFDHPRAEITALGYEPSLGLFYGTPEGAGYVGSRFSSELLRAPDTQFLFSRHSLYLLPPGGGVIRVGELARYALRDAELARAGVPVERRVSSPGTSIDAPSEGGASFSGPPPAMVADEVASAAYFWDAAARARDSDAAGALVRVAVDSLLGVARAQLPAGAAALPLPAEGVKKVMRARARYSAASNETQRAAMAAATIEDERLLARKLLTDAPPKPGTGDQMRKLLDQLDQRFAEAQAQRDAWQRNLIASVAAALDELRPRDARLRGIAEAVECLPESPASCAGQRACEEDYRKGYRTGRRLREARLHDAFGEGQEAHRNHRPASGFARPDAVDPCGSDWVDAFNVGYRN